MKTSKRKKGGGGNGVRRLGGQISVLALTCYLCNRMIWSQNRHDFSVCACAKSHPRIPFHAIDGGFDYTKISYINDGTYELERVLVSSEEFELGIKDLAEYLGLDDYFAYKGSQLLNLQYAMGE